VLAVTAFLSREVAKGFRRKLPSVKIQSACAVNTIQYPMDTRTIGYKVNSSCFPFWKSEFDSPARLQVAEGSIDLPYTSKDTTVGIMNGYTLDGRHDGVQVLLGARCFSSCRSSQFRFPHSLLSNGYQSCGDKVSLHEADHSRRASAGIKNTRIFASSPPYSIIA
jgi:hypothetical protein